MANVLKTTFGTAFAILSGVLAVGVLADTAPIPAPAPTPKPGKVFVGSVVDAAKSNTAESTAGDLVADAIRDTGHADLAFVPADELVMDAKIDAGNHDPADLRSILHYPDDDKDTVVVLNLTGKQVMDALERSVSRMPDPFDGFLQVSGVQFRFDASKPMGERVIQADGLGAPIASDKHYTVAVTRALANGSFGYFLIWDKSAVDRDTGMTVDKSLTDFAGAHSTLSPIIEGRIVTL